MERSTCHLLNGNFLNPRFLSSCYHIVLLKMKLWCFCISQESVYPYLSFNIGYIRLRLTTTMVWSSTKVQNRRAMSVLCAVFLLQKSFWVKARRPAWVFVLHLLSPGWLVFILLLEPFWSCYSNSISYYVIIFVRPPPLWGAMKHLHQKIPEVASRKSQMYGYLLEQEK